ncbi:glycosyltransferase 61 family protein [Hyphococcus sp.]|uniref:glycosyltransferase 61 family protein n=1 Tax=Hyphococcus sp. TaxID=2038636 RepID=UPI0035C6D7F5
MASVPAFFRHSKIQAPLARLRSDVSGVWRALFSATGKYAPLAKEDIETRQEEFVPFKGDIPLNAGDEYGQRRHAYVKPRPVFEEVENLVVTPGGGAWKEGVLYERYSAEKPGLRMLMADRKPSEKAPAGIFIQSEHVDTFGDWMAEYLTPLAQLPQIDAPVFLPASMAAKGYVRRDGARLGIEFRGVDRPVLIERAKVLRQPRVLRYWRAEQVQALKELLKANPPPPAPGSLLYLSREGEQSEVADRTYPSLMVEKEVRARGGKVLRTAEASLEDYLDAAQYAETLLYDHGSAAYNMVYWRPRRAIEFVSDDWWVNAFLFFADGLGVRDYTILCTDRSGLKQRLAAVLDVD